MGERGGGCIPSLFSSAEAIPVNSSFCGNVIMGRLGKVNIEGTQDELHSKGDAFLHLKPLCPIFFLMMPAAYVWRPAGGI